MAYANTVKNIEIENARIRFCNFSGKEKRYNREGDRNFCLVIDDPDLVDALIKEGWNVKIRAPREPGDTPQHYIQVTVNFKFWKQPEIYLISGRKKTPLDEESVCALDYADIQNCDLVVRPRVWDDDGVTKIKAYLQEMYVTVAQSRFASKYANEDFGDEEDPF